MFRVALIAALVLVPAAAEAESVTYDFTGVVTGTTGFPTPKVGIAVQGTYTLDLLQGDPTLAQGTTGSQTSNWFVQSYGGDGTGRPLPQTVFATDALALTLVRYPGLPALPANFVVSDAHGTIGGTPEFYAEEEHATASGSYFSSLDLTSSDGTIPWSAAGLPLWTAGSTVGYGLFSFNTASGNQSVNFSITSLMPVPLPAAVWLVLSGFGGLGMLGRLRKAAA